MRKAFNLHLEMHAVGVAGMDRVSPDGWMRSLLFQALEDLFKSYSEDLDAEFDFTGHLRDIECAGATLRGEFEDVFDDDID